MQVFYKRHSVLRRILFSKENMIVRKLLEEPANNNIF
jgi:hypothetical protein